MEARRIWRDVANVVWYYITHLQAEINNRAVYIYISSGTARGGQVVSGFGRYGNAGSRRHINVPKRGV